MAREFHNTKNSTIGSETMSEAFLQKATVEVNFTIPCMFSSAAVSLDSWSATVPSKSKEV